ncbi:MAG: hypothetical protein KAI73_08640 [Rhodospirillaceae bacterium]|nr:hypothetical protein [Rhodospirillaceae bacterium]
MTEAIGYMGDTRQFGPEYDIYLARREAAILAENPQEIDENTMTEVRKTAKILNELIAAKRETQ